MPELLKKNNIMKTIITIQERLHDQCVNASSVNELMSITSDFTAEIVEADNIFLSIEKYLCGCGTWKTSAFANKYYFGKDLAALIKNALSGHITHDEDKVFTPADFEDDITEAVFELANDYFNE